MRISGLTWLGDFCFRHKIIGALLFWCLLLPLFVVGYVLTGAIDSAVEAVRDWWTAYRATLRGYA